MQSLLLGTRNPGKVKEIASILADSGWSYYSLQEFPNVGEADENFVTFAENAIAKAQFYASATGLFALADDSGLEVAALGGAPGVLSARYAGENASDADRRVMLLSELEQTGHTDRRARFVSVVAIANPAWRQCLLASSSHLEISIINDLPNRTSIRTACTNEFRSIPLVCIVDLGDRHG